METIKELVEKKRTDNQSVYGAVADWIQVLIYMLGPPRRDPDSRLDKKYLKNFADLLTRGREDFQAMKALGQYYARDAEHFRVAFLAVENGIRGGIIQTYNELGRALEDNVFPLLRIIEQRIEEIIKQAKLEERAKLVQKLEKLEETSYSLRPPK